MLLCHTAATILMMWWHSATEDLPLNWVLHKHKNFLKKSYFQSFNQPPNMLILKSRISCMWWFLLCDLFSPGDQEAFVFLWSLLWFVWRTFHWRCIPYAVVPQLCHVSLWKAEVRYVLYTWMLNERLFVQTFRRRGWLPAVSLPTSKTNDAG